MPVLSDAVLVGCCMGHSEYIESDADDSWTDLIKELWHEQT